MTNASDLASSDQRASILTTNETIANSRLENFEAGKKLI